jgi:hypothetical protein
MSEKVYCSNCTYNGANCFSRKELCNYPENLSKRMEDNWFQKSNITIWIGMANCINEKNDCKWFKEKEIF